MCNLGELARCERRNEEARRRLNECLEIASELENARLEVEAIRNLALLEHGLGHPVAARAHAERARSVAVRSGLRDYEGRALLTLAEVHGGPLMDATMSGRYGDATAEKFYLNGIAMLRKVGNLRELAKGLAAYARYKIEHGEAAAGRQLLREARDHFQRLGMKQSVEADELLAAL